MGNDLQIIMQSSNQLVVHSPTNVFTLATFITVFGTVGILLFAYFTVSTGTALSAKRPLLWAAILTPTVVLATAVWSHTLLLSHTNGSGTIVNKFAGITYSTQSVPLADMKRAVMESARPGTRIAIVLQDGDEAFPFGKAYNPKPSQYKVIDLINDFVNPSHANHGEDNEDYFRKLHEREAVEAAKKANQVHQ